MLVQAKSVRYASLHKRLPLWHHLYVWPFIIIYSIIAYFYLYKYEQYFGSEEVRFLVFGGSFLLNVLCYLSTHWFKVMHVICTCLPVNDPFEADVIRIEAAEHRGKGAICEIKSISKTELSADRTTVMKTRTLFFEFQKKKLFYDAEKKIFKKPDYPESYPFSEYKHAQGIGKNAGKSVEEYYGKNHFDIPTPTFQELFKEHAVAPFFVFQMFCVGLWFMDEYWYYSLFTLFMLFVFESTVVAQRLRNLSELKSMSQQPYDIHVYRDRQWTLMKTDELLPGDLISIVRQKSEDITVPCDILILGGHCIVNEAMLSGESTPLIKESIQNHDNDNDLLDMKKPEHKIHILFGGTKIVQHSDENVSSKLKAPDGGCIGYVLKTGFGTMQGKLVRTMLYSADRVTANNFESFLFILVLLAFAIAASYYVWQVGLESGRKKSKLILDCILIITSVVPPELPLELSLAVNQSLLSLSRLAIFCLEPFRIPFAGRVDICCFDKTGTLTSDKLVLDGIAGSDEAPQELTPADKASFSTTICMAACQSLAKTDGGIVGDPMEKVLLESMRWTLTSNDIVTSTVPDRKESRIHIIKRFPFSSALKRMSTISGITSKEESKSYNSETDGLYLVAVKGAPEILRDMLAKVPSFYDDTYRHFAMNGYRVLCLAFKWMDLSKVRLDSRAQHCKNLDRTSVESSLTFAGFLIFNSPLKPDSKVSVTELQQSSHRVIMITGDNSLTACHVAKELNITKKPILIFDVISDVLLLESIDGKQRIKISNDILSSKKPQDKILELSHHYNFCMTGKALDIVAPSALYLNWLLPLVWIYARVSPSQKELILTGLKRFGYTTLMCGDGTNDVGALKQAHIGVALLDGTVEDLEKIARIGRERRLQAMKKQQEELYKKWGIEIPKENASAESSDKKAAAIKKQQETMNKLMESVDGMEEMPVLKFGDASVASSFTSKVGSITSVCNILRQGRCTLVTTIQMYKILALNCLISAFSLSALYLDGIKHGDTQITIQGFLISGCFLFLSWGKPINRLSKERPQPNIFNLYIIISVFGQFLTHVASLWFVVIEAKKWLPEDWKVDLENTKFEPNILNSAVYLISLSMQVSTFMINYQGQPFRESLRENKPLFWSLSSLLGLAVVCASQVLPELNQTMELVKFPTSFSELLVMAILIDFSISWLIEFAAHRLFGDNKPLKHLLISTPDEAERGVKAPKFIAPQTSRP